jgi:hypothetical protein
MTTDDQTGNDRWQEDYEDFIHGRMVRVQAAAQQWLVTMTSLLGLFSAVVVVGGGNAIEKVPHGIAQATIVALAAVVYILAFVAVYQGAKATFGGLGLRPAGSEERAYAKEASGLQNDDGPHDLAPLAEIEGRIRKKQGLDQWREWWSPPPLLGGVHAYVETYEHKTNRLRTHLHRSRVLGIVASVLSGVLGWALLLLRATA